jgi:hypothetical protein
MHADHDGTTMTWKGRVATITAPDGSTRELSMRDFRTLRAGGSAGDSQTPPPADQQEAPAPPTESPAEPRTPRVGRPAERPKADPVNRAISRQNVEDALTRATLAELFRSLSRAISEWDGAGERGVFTATEAATIADLLYDQTIDVVVRRFAGDVSRFKAVLAVAIIAAGKGRIHAAAIAERQRRIRAGLPPAPVLPVQSPADVIAGDMPTAAQEAVSPAIIMPFPTGNGHEPGLMPPTVPYAVPQPAQPDAGGAFVPMTPAMLAERQAAWARENAPTDSATARALADTTPSAIDRIFGD